MLGVVSENFPPDRINAAVLCKAESLHEIASCTRVRVRRTVDFVVAVERRAREAINY